MHFQKTKFAKDKKKKKKSIGLEVSAIPMPTNF